MSIAQNFPNIKPSLMLSFADTKQLDSRITYTRASTASFYNGVSTAMAEQNLLTYSQEFDNAVWQLGSTTVTANTTAAPDGTTTAETLTATASTNRHSIFRAAGTFATVNGSAYMASFFVKANTNNFIQIFVSNQGADFANFNLSTGAVGTTGGTGSSATITSVGNSWYRITMPYTAGGTDRDPALAITSSASVARGEVWTTVGTESVYIWGAQLEQRSAVTAYTATTTQAITNYVPVLLTAGGGQPRFDHNPTTSESLGLLIEQQSTNLCLYSSEFNIAPWTINSSSVTITANTVVAPDGTITGDLIKSNSLGNDFVYQAPTLATTTVATYSFYIKNVDATISRMMARNSVTSMEVVINWSGSTLSSLTLNTGTSTSFVAVGNGWYRVQATFTTGETNQQFRIYPDSLVAGKSAFVWGAQIETGSFATSYIATTSAATTRAADAASMTGTNFSSWYNAGEGTLYSEAKLLAVPGGSTYPGIVKISTDSANKIGFWTIPAATSMYFSVSANSTSSADISIAQSPVSNFVKISGVYKVNDFAASVNASTVGTDTSGVIPVVNKMDIGTYDNSWNGTIKKIAYYPLRVTNAQLQSLTS
jgi:hypothetical protein